MPNKKYFINVEPADDVPTEREICVAVSDIIEDVTKDRSLKKEEAQTDLQETTQKKTPNKKNNLKRKKIVSNIAFVVLLCLGAIIVAYVYALLVVVEGEVNRTQIIAEIEKATGRKMDVNSRITFEAFPVPKFIINGINIKNKDQSVNKNFIEIASLEAQPSLFYLILGTVKISDLNFINTTLNIENFISGKNNWNIGNGKSQGGKPKGSYIPLNSVALLKEYLNINKINIKNLNINLYSGKKEKPIKRNFNLANISFIADSANGPYNIQGNVYANKAGLNFNYSMILGKVEQLNQIVEMPISLGIYSKTTKLDFKGFLKNDEYGFQYTGKMQGVLDNSIQYIRQYIPEDSKFFSDIVSGILVGDGVEISSDFKLSNRRVILRDFVVNNKMLDGSSDFEMIFGKVSKVNLRLRYKTINVDSIIKRSSKAEILSRNDSNIKNETANEKKKYKITDIGLPDDINIRIKSDIAEIIYKNKVLKNTKLDMRAGSYLAINRIEIFSFPGGGNLRGGGKVLNSPSGPKFEGKIKVAVKDLKDLIIWYNPSTKGSFDNSKIYRDFYLNSNVSISSDTIRFPNLSIGIDGSKIRGRLTLKRNNSLIANSSLTISVLDLNKYELFQKKDAHDLNASYAIFEFLRTIDNIFESLTINLNTDKVYFKGKKYNDFSTVASFSGGISQLVGINYNVDGDEVNGSITLDNRRLNPEVEIVFDFDKIDENTLLSFITRDSNRDGENDTDNIFLSNREFMFADLGILRGKIRLNIKELIYGKLENDKLKKVKISLVLERDKIKVNNFSARAFKGNIRLVGGINIGARSGVEFNYYLTNIEIRDFLSTMFSIRNIEGRVNSSGQMILSGNTLAQWIKTMTGGGALVSRGVTFYGFDTKYLLSKLPKVKKSVRRARFTVSKALSTGKTHVNFLSGGYQFYKGKILLAKKYSISSPEINGFSTNGYIDLIKNLVNISMEYRASSSKGRGMGYPMNMKISGSLDFPRAIWNQKRIIKTWEKARY